MALLFANKKLHFGKSSGVVEPNAQGCAFVHPMFGKLVNKIMILRTLNLALSNELRTQFWTASAVPVVELDQDKLWHEQGALSRL